MTLEDRGLEDRVIGGTVDEEILHQTVRAVVAVGVVVPHLLLGTQVAVIVVEAVDELFAVNVALIGFTAVPQVDVGVDDEVFLAILLVHLLTRSLRSGLSG